MGLSKEHYVPLIQDDDPNTSRNSGLERGSVENVIYRFRDEPCSPSKAKRSSVLTKFLIVVLIILAIVQSITIVYMSRSGQKQQCKQSLSGVIPMKDVYRPQFKLNAFMSENETEASAAWDAIEAGHGVVALDPEWAAARGLQPSVMHPLDPEKSIYNIAAYHSIHCLKLLRKHYVAVLKGEEIYWEEHHDLHCFDSLRQNIMCAADDNLLYATGHRDAGYGQTVQCKDWDALREWATEHSACYYDFEGSTIGHLGHCDGGEDGLPRGSLL